MPHFRKTLESTGVETYPCIYRGMATKPGLEEFQTSHCGLTVVIRGKGKGHTCPTIKRQFPEGPPRPA